MRRGRKTAAFLFRGICVIFSLLLLIMSLLQHVALTRCRDNIASLQQELAAEADRKAQLQIRLEMSLPLETLEANAIQNLGMQHPTQEQIITLEIAG